MDKRYKTLLKFCGKLGQVVWCEINFLENTIEFRVKNGDAQMDLVFKRKSTKVYPIEIYNYGLFRGFYDNPKEIEKLLNLLKEGKADVSVSK